MKIKIADRHKYSEEVKRFIFYFFILALFPIKFNTLLAQTNVIDTTNSLKVKKNQMDVRDLLQLISKKKKIFNIDTTSHKKKSLGPFYTPVPYPGYALVTGFLIGLTNNISFYTHHGEDAKISNILIENIYTQYKQFINIARSNIWLDHEKLNLLGEWRYYKFPTNTFGLGSKTSFSDIDPVDFSYLKISEVLMKEFAKNLTGGIGMNIDYHWNVRETNNQMAIPTDFYKYGLFKKTVSSALTLNVQYDNRLNSNNPSKGTYANLQVRNNFKILGSDHNWESIILDARHYIPLSKKTGNVLALWTYNWVTLSGMPPYFDMPSTGWDTYNNIAREYVEGRFRGLNLLYAEAEYRFRLTKNGLLGGVLFSNISTLTEWPSNKFEKANPGGGLGLRVKMHKLSNSNLCIDYGFGAGGSRGFSFNINEVF